ncbi:TonB-dependent receptor plug domain-containing protein [Mucilaginibacter myungsuensis]
MRKRVPIEKVYLHIDKSHYNLSDTLWFKAYVTNADNSPTKQSGLLYVELIDDSTDVVRRVSLPIKFGTCDGNISLNPKVFHDGAYTLRAYTNWMRNFGDDQFFDQRFYLGSSPQKAWLVNAKAALTKVDGSDRLDVDVKLNNPDRSAVTLRDVKVKLYSGNKLILEDDIRTGINGSLRVTKDLKKVTDRKNLMLQVLTRNKSKLVQIPVFVDSVKQIDLQFMPEGGNLVAGQTSVLGFKAITDAGKGIQVNGAIYDSKNIKVTDIASLYRGIGEVSFTPLPGERYVARLSTPGIVAKEYQIPAAMPAGTLLQIDNVTDTDSLKVSVRGIENNGLAPSYTVLGTARGRLYFTRQIPAVNRSFAISKREFPTGVTAITLMRGNIPLNERLVFIDHQDRLNIRVTSDKIAYGKRELVNLEIAVTDQAGVPAQADLSLAVTDLGQVRADTLGNNNIATSLLLKSQLKGDIETPGQYFANNNVKTRRALDNLMLTQGWSAYGIRAALRGFPTRYRAEGPYEIEGTIADQYYKPIPNVPVFISSKIPPLIAKTMADSTGKFIFKGLVPNDTTSYFIQARRNNNKELREGRVLVNNNWPLVVPNTKANVLVPWYVNSDELSLRQAKLSYTPAFDDDVEAEGTLLRNVNIGAKKFIKGSRNPFGEGRSDLAYDEADLRESGTTNIWQFLKQKLPGIYETVVSIFVPENPIPYQYPRMNVLKLGQHYVAQGDLALNGVAISVSKYMLMNMTIQDLAGIEVSYSKKYTNSTTLHLRRPPTYNIARIDITTKVQIELGRRPDNIKYSVAIFRPMPVMYGQQFYSPKYTSKNNDAIPDYRSTIFWEPNLRTNFNGRAKVSFYTSDLPQNYGVNIQGLSAEGELGSAVIKMPNK